MVMPCHDSGQWRSVRPVLIPETVSYKARRAQDGEMVVGKAMANPTTKTQLNACKILQKKRQGKANPQVRIL